MKDRKRKGEKSAGKGKIVGKLAKENGIDLYPLPDRLYADDNGKSGRYDRRNG